LIFQRANPPQPAREFALHARIAPLTHHFIRGLHRPQNTFAIAGEPRGLGTDCSQRTNTLQLLCGTAERPRLF
jgi:hypothetical protein